MQANFKEDEFRAFQAFLESACGIIVSDNKQYLVSSRLTSLMRNNEIACLNDLVKKLENGTSSLRSQVVDAMTTNETQWFRDTYPFAILEKVVFPELVSNAVQKARIWSAASSYGQEAYSISMMLDEYNKANRSMLDAEIVGTDISTIVINTAASALYDVMTVERGLSEVRKKRYFSKDNHVWKLDAAISSRVTFKLLNLLQSYEQMGKFDVIFCRNVLIYFSPETKSDIIKRLTRQLKPGGILFVGASEAVTKYSDRYKMVRAEGGIFYRLGT